MPHSYPVPSEVRGEEACRKQDLPGPRREGTVSTAQVGGMPQRWGRKHRGPADGVVFLVLMGPFLALSRRVRIINCL